ncbi:Aromatic peroxygenase [Ceratobasidium theobromae]|uniref:Aromatic peroxygenase n=1 Tax=Ceratobasidium theobromae TaxID=1582974 RepID=A0A5N5QIM9_9AGAM|nr:Aromatic peroxygenase [Ceratobasidium theobromae]
MQASLSFFPLALVGLIVAFPTTPSNSGAAGSGCPYAAAQVKCQLVKSFDPVKQRIDVSGEHEFQPPGLGDQQALANHGYINCNGMTNLAEAAYAAHKVFGFGSDLATAASTLGVIFAGNPVTGEWPISGPLPGPVIPPLLTSPPGLSGTHNKYEGDASPTCMDAYINNGDTTTLNMEILEHLYNLVPGICH